MQTPAADIDVGDALVRRLLEQQHPDLADLELRLLANGWDNVLYRLGDELVVRVPRRQIVAGLIENEQRWLPELAPRLSTLVPVPVRVGTPTDEFPYSWTIARWFDGELASRVPFAEHDGVATQLARFVAELHQPAQTDAPHNAFRGVPLEERAETVEERFTSGLIRNLPSVREIWNSALRAQPWTAPQVWLHGDLHPANILIRDGRLAAVIDFGDMAAGDPATDLATAWLTFDASGRQAFRAALDYDDATWARARGWAIALGTAFVVISADNSSMSRIGVHALEQVLLD